MSQVTSPYNFVPAPRESEVFKPLWAKQVSHDIPFSDGESGEIELKITAQTPIFIRNGHGKDYQTNEFSQFYDKDGRKHYFIPGTSIKGMLRNVLEIISFSRLNPNLVNNDRYAYRDLTRDSLYLNKFKNQEILGGWLLENEDGSWQIEECEGIAFIHHSELKKKGFPFRDEFLNKGFSDKTALFKYESAKQLNLKLNWTFAQTIKQLFGNVTRNMAHFDDNGKHGTLVFTGQSSKRKEFDDPNRRPSGKVHEFVLFDASTPKLFAISREMQRDFKFIYHNDDKNNISKDWEFWRNEFLDKGKKVPVFFSKSPDGKISHFGLAYMYKLPYSNSVHQMLPIHEYENDLDLATTIFGFSDKKIDASLKGRVIIGHAMAQNIARPISEQKEIMASPKASYFPYYLEQNEKNVNTYDNISTLRGFKRYPARNSTSAGNYDDKQKSNKKIFSSFIPLGPDTEFVCKIRFNNLKEQEIGALISAITFNGKKSCYHTIGGAKAFGYGKVKIEIQGLKYLKNDESHYLESFCNLMKSHLNSWEKSPQLIELFAMASNKSDAMLAYPSIEDFVQIKKDKDSLHRFSDVPQPQSQLQISLPKTGKAVVSVIAGKIIQAILTEGSDQGNITLEIPQSKLNKRPRKKGEIVNVKIVYKGNKIDKLVLD